MGRRPGLALASVVAALCALAADAGAQRGGLRVERGRVEVERRTEIERERARLRGNDVGTPDLRGTLESPEAKAALEELGRASRERAAQNASIEAYDRLVEQAGGPRLGQRLPPPPLGWSETGHQARLRERALDALWDPLPRPTESTPADAARIERARRLMNATGRSPSVAVLPAPDGVVLVEQYDELRVAVLPLDAAHDAALRTLLSPSTERYQDVFVDEDAWHALRRAGLVTDGWRIYHGFRDTFPVLENVYAPTAEIAAELVRTMHAPLPARRFAFSLLADPVPEPGAEDLTAAPGWIPSDRAPRTFAQLKQVFRKHPRSIITVVTHVDGDLVQVGDELIDRGQIEAAAEKSDVLVLVLGCNSASGGVGIVGQIQYVPLVRQVKTAMRATTRAELYAALATPKNPLLLDEHFTVAIDRLRGGDHVVKQDRDLVGTTDRAEEEREPEREREPEPEREPEAPVHVRLQTPGARTRGVVMIDAVVWNVALGGGPAVVTAPPPQPTSSPPSPDGRASDSARGCRGGGGETLLAIVVVAAVIVVGFVIKSSP